MAYIGNQPYQVAFLVDTFSGTGTTTAFTTSVAPANTASVLVAISGVLQDPSTYSVSGNTLTFSQAPPTGTSNISARYLGIPASGVTTTAYRTVTTFTATANQTTFTPPSYTVGFINVFRNGVLLTPTTDYTASNGTTVVLVSGATSGDTVIIESFYVSSVLNAVQQYNGQSTNQTLTTPILTSPSLTTPTLITPTVTNNLSFGTSNAGIVFNNSSALTNSTLNDYETGTWTPSIGGTATYTIQDGAYTKIGRFVYCICKIQINAIGTGSTTALSGLPFTSSSTPNVAPNNGIVDYFGNLASSVITLIPSTSNSIVVNFTSQTVSGNTTSNASTVVFQSGTRIDFSITYQANF
jgi:hypothetical protein